MPKQQELDQCYMKIALEMSKLSKAKRKQVGSVISTQQGVLLVGVNGTPSGWNNTCEYNDITSDFTLHSELNSLMKAAKEGISVVGSTLYVTLSPCPRCCAMIAQAGIREVAYLEEYRDKTGLYELMKHGIIVRKITLEELK